ncbi:MAG: PAS domain S-box protein [Burkholderiaceae bacterium]|nr:PAS domain S-box protein [Burkholderiaceae bacterium]
MNAAILIVEDEAIVALDLKLQLQDLGYQVVGMASSAADAVAAVHRHRPGLVLMDVRLQGQGDGIDAAEQIRREHATPVIFLTSHSDAETVQRAARTAPYGYLTKPYQLKELRAGIEVALTKAQLERQLREADRWFASTLQCVADGVVVTDLQARVRFLNPAAESLTGWPSEDAAGRSVDEVVRLAPEGGGAAAAGLVRDVIAEGRPRPVLHGQPLLHRAGADKVVDNTASPVRTEDGQALGAVLVLRDATERLAHEAQLRASEERFRSTFDHAPLGMALVSVDGHFLQVNDALCRLLGVERDRLHRGSHTEFTVEADREHEVQRLHELASGQTRMVQFEKRYLRPAPAEPVWTLVSVSQLGDGPQATCHLYQVHDLSEQKQAAERLAELAQERMRREASELASAHKSEFLSRVSHEMRTPLNAVIGFAQLMQMSSAALEPQQMRTYVDHIRSAGEHLLGLVTDLLDLNRAAQGALQLDLQPTRLDEVVAETRMLIEGLARSHGITLAVNVPEGLLVMADAKRLRQVLLNLGSNAIKYNRQGGEVRMSAQAGGAGQVIVSVKDSGIGMTPNQLERLYQPFDRLGAERTRVQGTGLGLVICRALVAEMKGTLVIDSEARVGTTAILTLPAAG